MSGSIPVLIARGRNLPEAWEQSLLLLNQGGCEIRTEYDRIDSEGEFIDPPSKDCKMIVVVDNPIEEPRIHKCFPGGPEDLQEYRMEVVEGIKDHWVDLSDKSKWQYTYHGRLTKYLQLGMEPDGEVGMSLGQTGVIDQIEKMCQQLAKSPYTRRCQAITWQPWEDMDSSDPPCLQRIWLRILIDEDGEWWLNMDVDFRSRDAYKAAFMNMDAFIYWMEVIAARVSELAGRPVHLGRYTDTSNSYHIYGKDLEQFEREFLVPISKRAFYSDDPLYSRTARFEDWSEMMEMSRDGILAKVAKQDANRRT